MSAAMSHLTAYSAGGEARSAVLSEDGVYRYRLTRRWGFGPTALFIMLNPSTADAMQDDPTIRRCRGYVKTWGMNAVEVVYLYAYRATKPADLPRERAAVGPENDRHIRAALRDVWITNGVAVAAWGAHGKADRVAEVVDLAHSGRIPLLALGTTKGGHPRHPLYVKGDTALSPWAEPS